MDFEDILSSVGDFGRFQSILVYLIFVPISTLVPFFEMANIFFVSSPDHWCHVSQLVNHSMVDQKRLISPVFMKAGDLTYDKCNMYDIDYNVVANNFHLYNDTIGNITDYGIKSCDNGWQFDKTYYDNTAVTHVSLVELDLIN